MAFRQRRERLRSILNGSACIRPGSVYDATSIRIAEDLGFELGMFGGSVASLAMLGDPDITLITLTELAEQMRRMSRASDLAGAGRCRPRLWQRAQCPPHRAGTGGGRRRRPHHRGYAAAAGLWRQPEPQLISLEEGVGKMKAALDGRSDPSLVIMGRTGTRGGGPTASSFEDCLARARAYEATGVDALFFTGLTNARRSRGDFGGNDAADRARQYPGRTRRRARSSPASG